jgi:hypothetical protein
MSFVNASDLKQEKQWVLDSRLSGYFQKVDIENGTSNKEGFTQSHELDIKYHGSIADANAGIEARARTTNDNRVQNPNSQLLFLRGYYTTKYWNIELGDVAASMNSYVYGGSVKGLKVEYKGNEKTKNWDYKFISGVRKAKWRETYQTIDDEILDTYIAAFEAKYTHERAKVIKFSIATLKDDLTSGDSLNAPGNKGTSIGLDGKWRFNKYITLKGKAAVARSTNDLRANKPMNSENALQLRLLTRPLKSVKSNFLYQRISTNFLSVTGKTAGDNEKLENKTTWSISKQLRAKLSIKTSRDNLDGALGATQRTHYQALNFLYKPEFIKRSSIDFKFTNKNVDGRGVKTNQYTAGINANLRQKNGFRYGLGYNYLHLSDSINYESSQTINNIKFILGYKQKLQENSSYRITTTFDAQNVRQKNNNEEKYGVKIDAGYKYNKRLSMDLAFISRNMYKDETDDSINNTYRFRTTYRLDDKGKNVIRLLLEKHDYDVENDAQNSYNEHIGKISYVMNF